jgi:hypothetical protein
VAQRTPLSASLPIDPPPPTPPHHALTRAEGGEKKRTQFSNSQDRHFAMTLRDMSPHSRGAMRPDYACLFRPTKGVGNAGRQCTRSLACKIKIAYELVTTVAPVHPTFPHGVGFNKLLRALPGDQGLLTPSPADKFRRLDANLEASGPHDFTVRVWRIRQSAISRPPHPAALRS